LLNSTQDNLMIYEGRKRDDCKPLGHIFSVSL